MPDSNDYRKFLEEKFDMLEEILKEVKQDGKETKQHAILTNSRVTHLEDFKDDVAIPALKERVKREEFDAMKSCAGECLEKLEKMDSDLTEYRFIKAHPFWASVIIAVVVGGMILTSIGSVKNIALNKEEKQMMNKVNQIEETIQQLHNSE